MQITTAALGLGCFGKRGPGEGKVSTQTKQGAYNKDIGKSLLFVLRWKKIFKLADYETPAPMPTIVQTIVWRLVKRARLWFGIVLAIQVLKKGEAA